MAWPATQRLVDHALQVGLEDLAERVLESHEEVHAFEDALRAQQVHDHVLAVRMEDLLVDGAHLLPIDQFRIGEDKLVTP